MPLPLQLVIFGHIVCVRHAPGLTHMHDPAAYTDDGAIIEAITGAAMILAMPIVLIISPLARCRAAAPRG